MSQTPVIEETRVEDPLKTGGPWKVVLWDDDEHTYDYVIEMLMEVCVMTMEQAFHHAVEVDTQKKTVVYSGEFEHAEHIQELILEYGPDPRMAVSKGSMSATLEKS
ncbi:ATP-dependent Clp protease adaptor ClpS [Leptospira fletcheri]|uniref:ATP-dependent Clp protease adaptor ClpS n=1 Tax=Leptospira fletcheri TaxID=2484981 RepID=A0A4R9GDH1_9LEPT|nr:ATP-dependent Clp protease adaptor ClpS [Leptospira fletcheri]TGK09888.1 ATP-dependent Clp protease adaptor ClpS [Leptospira fletcheri]